MYTEIHTIVQSNAAHKHKPQDHMHLDTHTHTAKIFPALHNLIPSYIKRVTM